MDGLSDGDVSMLKVAASKLLFADKHSANVNISTKTTAFVVFTSID